MLEKIQKKLAETYNKTDIRGMFISLFDEKEILLCSNGVLTTDKPIMELTEIIYHGILEKYPTAKKVAIDIVLEIQTQTDMQKLMTMSPKERGFALLNKDSNGIILPNTKGVEDIKTALSFLKQKNNFTGNVEIYSFKTRRFAFEV